MCGKYPLLFNLRPIDSARLGRSLRPASHHRTALSLPRRKGARYSLFGTRSEGPSAPRHAPDAESGEAADDRVRLLERRLSRVEPPSALSHRGPPATLPVA
jgi:hypothetical protein